MDSQAKYAAVSEHYGALGSATTQASGNYGRSVAKAFGYVEEELRDIPDEANMGLSCGNPLAIATLTEGETAIDLGSGGGFDVFQAARKVGPQGCVIGIDMNQDMINLAEKNKTKAGLQNVRFVHSRIDSIPLEPAVADAIISNCVINLVPEEDKHLVFKEMHRLLKPGGRVAVSDILAKKPLPEKLRTGVAAYVGCIAGASMVSQYEAYLKEAGFSEILIADSKNDLNVYITAQDGSGGEAMGCCGPPQSQKGCCGPSEQSQERPDLLKLEDEIGGIDLNEWVGSYKIYAVKS